MFPPTSVPGRGVRMGVYEHRQPTLVLLKSPSTVKHRPPKAWLIVRARETRKRMPYGSQLMPQS